jgi:hypothetical protein
MKIQVCCVRCGTTNSDRVAVEEAVQYQRDLTFDPGSPDSLLSEGCIRDEVAEATSEGVNVRLIEREGPTRLVVTTTAVSLHAENETRLISVPIDDSAGQTARVMRAIASWNGRPPDLSEWHELQYWLAGGERRVEVPFADALADLIPPVAVRLRRDFGSLLGLVARTLCCTGPAGGRRTQGRHRHRRGLRGGTRARRRSDQRRDRGDRQ